MEIEGFKYHIGKLDAFQQFHVTRRITPIMAAVGMSVEKLKGAVAGSETMSIEALLGPAADVMARMPDADVDFVLHTCLSVVTREQIDGRMAPVLVQRRLAFADIQMPVMMKLTIAVIRENLTSFFSLPPDASA